MYRNYQIVVNTAAGRRRYMQYLIPYVVASEIVDRYDLWLNTINKQDIVFLKILAKKYPKINLVWQPDGVINGNKSINAFYKDCIEENTIYFKLDDDIIWMEPDLIEKMVKFRIDNPNYFLVSPLVINNALSTYLLQVKGKLSLNKYYKSSASHEILWKSGKFASDLHNWFFSNYLVKDKVSELYVGSHPMGMTRFSINAILWFGDEMKKFSGVVPGDDEEFMSCIYPTINGLSNCWNGDAIVSHFAFFTQRERLDKEAILEKYGDFLKKEWDASVKYQGIYKDILDAMKYVDVHKEELEVPPYQAIAKTKKKREKFLMKCILPYYICKYYLESLIEKQNYIET